MNFTPIKIGDNELYVNINTVDAFNRASDAQK